VQWEALKKTLALHRSDRTVSVSEFVRDFAPRGFVRRHVVAIATGSVAAAAMVLTTGAYTYRSYVEQDMATPGPVCPPTEPTLEQRKTIADYLGQASDDLAEAKLGLNSEDLTYILSDGANNVDEILNSALQIDPCNKTALKMKARIASLYEQKARELASSGRSAEAMPLLKRGLVAKPDDRNLRRLQRDICTRDPKACVTASL
jgi:hypothetical protein